MHPLQRLPSLERTPAPLRSGREGKGEFACSPDGCPAPLEPWKLLSICESHPTSFPTLVGGPPAREEQILQTSR